MVGGRLTCLFGCILLLGFAKALPRKVYTVTVKTSEDIDAGADPKDKVFIKLFGDKHITDYKILKGDDNAFQRNTVTMFEINAQDVGKIQSFSIKKTAQGKADKWNLQKVSVEDKEGDVYEAMCKCWLSKEQGLERTLVPTNVHKKSMLNDPVMTTSSPTGSPVPGSSTPTKSASTTSSATGNKDKSSDSNEITMVPTLSAGDILGLEADAPTAKPASGNPSPPTPAEDIAGLILFHINNLRLLHGTGPVILEKNMSTIAAQVAKKLTATNGTEVEHDYGVNVCSYNDTAQQASAAAQDCVKRWYETVKNFDWSSSVVKPENSEFAQLIWKDTTHVGISSSVQQGKESFIVVLFDPRYDSTYAAKENISPVKDVSDGTSQECTPPFSLYERSCYAYLDTPLKWDAAIAECAKYGASLASIDSQNTNTYLSGLVAGKRNITELSSEAWIGFTDRLQESRYQWTDGSAVTFYHFLPNEPTGQGENCVAMMSSSNASGWVDKKCSEQLPAICKMPIQAPISYKITVLIEKDEEPAQVQQPYYNNAGYTGYMGGYSAGYPSYNTGYGYQYGKKKSGIPKVKNPLKHKHTHGHKRSFVPGLTDYVALIKKRMNDLEKKPWNFIGDSSMIGSDGGYYVSVYLKQPFPVQPSPAQALQTYLENNKNHLAPNNTANATVACVSIVCPGSGCITQCSTTCSSQCGSTCCSGATVINPQPVHSAAPAQAAQYPAPAPYPSPYPYPYPSPYPYPYPSQYGEQGCVRSCSKKATRSFCPAYCPKNCCKNKY